MLTFRSKCLTFPAILLASYPFLNAATTLHATNDAKAMRFLQSLKPQFARLVVETYLDQKFLKKEEVGEPLGSASCPRQPITLPLNPGETLAIAPAGPIMAPHAFIVLDEHKRRLDPSEAKKGDVTFVPDQYVTVEGGELKIDSFWLLEHKGAAQFLTGFDPNNKSISITITQ